MRKLTFIFLPEVENFRRTHHNVYDKILQWLHIHALAPTHTYTHNFPLFVDTVLEYCGVGN